MSDITAKQKAIQDIIDSTKDFLVPADIAPILGVDPHYIRIAARQKPELLKFEFFVSGNRTKIPRIPFLRYIGINIDQHPTHQQSQELHKSLDHTHMSNEELLFAITHQLSALKQEINERLDNIEHQAQDLNKVLLSARNFINALAGVIDSN